MVVVLRAGTQAAPVIAVVDSGATRSMFPWQIAQALGIEADLVQDAVGASGVEGGGFPTWSYPPGITGQIVRVPPQNPTQPQMWASPFALTPAFAHKDPFLLGRQDFFVRHIVTFHPGTPSMFTIEQ